MNKPGKKTKSYYDYHDIIGYIEKKYNINTGDYRGKFANKTVNNDVPYEDFWHWLCDQQCVNRGSFMYFPEDALEREDTPQFVKEIITLIEKEFGKEIYAEDIWVDW